MLQNSLLVPKLLLLHRGTILSPQSAKFRPAIKWNCGCQYPQRNTCQNEKHYIFKIKRRFTTQNGGEISINPTKTNSNDHSWDSAVSCWAFCASSVSRENRWMILWRSSAVFRWAISTVDKAECSCRNLASKSDCGLCTLKNEQLWLKVWYLQVQWPMHNELENCFQAVSYLPECSLPIFKSSKYSAKSKVSCGLCFFFFCSCSFWKSSGFNFMNCSSSGSFCQWKNRSSPIVADSCKILHPHLAQQCFGSWSKQK